MHETRSRRICAGLRPLHPVWLMLFHPLPVLKHDQDPPVMMICMTQTKSAVRASMSQPIVEYDPALHCGEANKAYKHYRRKRRLAKATKTGFRSQAHLPVDRWNRLGIPSTDGSATNHRRLTCSTICSVMRAKRNEVRRSPLGVILFSASCSG